MPSDGERVSLILCLVYLRFHWCHFMSHILLLCDDYSTNYTGNYILMACLTTALDGWMDGKYSEIVLKQKPAVAYKSNIRKRKKN